MQYPKHVAFIPDGNRTWSKRNNKSLQESYLLAYQRGLEMLKYMFTNTDTQVVTLRGMSSENTHKRPQEEYDLLMTLYKLVDSDLDDFLLANKIQFRRIGEGAGITQEFREYLDEKVEKTKCDGERYYIFAINYGGRDELVRGIQAMMYAGVAPEDVDEKTVSRFLELGEYPVVDLVVRTKGDFARRTSGFMSRWIGYAELYFTDALCPDFDEDEVKKALTRYDSIVNYRNFGK